MANDKSDGDPAVANDHDAEDLDAAHRALAGRDDQSTAEKAPDGSARGDDVDDVHRRSLAGSAHPDKAPFTMPGGRTEGVAEQER